MKISESIVGTLLNELESLTCRLRNIKYVFQNTYNDRLRERLIEEKKSIFYRVNEINKVAIILTQKNCIKISISSLLLEKSERTLREFATVDNLFFL